MLADGRLINLSAAEGHPAGVMDMSFANQALSVAYLARVHQELENKVYIVPGEIDREVARLKLRSMGAAIDELTDEQKAYLSSWRSRYLRVGRSNRREQPDVHELRRGWSSRRNRSPRGIRTSSAIRFGRDP